MHLVVGSALYFITWHLVLKRAWPMKEKINEIEENITRFF